MEDKKLLYLIGIVIIAILLTISIGLFFFLKKPASPLINQPPTPTNTNGALPLLPSAGDVTPAGQAGEGAISELAKEKQFISSFWQLTEIQYTPAIPPYSIPLKKIKEQVVNYWDFSRKVSLDPALENLSKNGFVVINNPFTSNVSDWESSYQLLKAKDLPLVITADSIVGLYQDTLHIIYKEIEQEIFYPSLWELLKEMADKVKERYETRQKQFGIETDLITEANRLELAYLTVALKLLQPDASQIKESITLEKTFFSSQEAEIYKITVPSYLADEVDQEIKLIDGKTKNLTKSPILLYQKTYQNYQIPENYRTSEKLKNYYLAISWLNDVLFPLWYEDNECPNCLLDQQDHTINFLAALYLSNDLAGDQNLKNRWANIYKSVSFFRGLEANLTYLDYQQALAETFGADFNLDALFATDAETVKQQIAALQEKISRFSFLEPLSGTKELKEQIGLRLLRNYHLLENKLFDTLTTPATGTYLKTLEKDEPLPFTTCWVNNNLSRCLPTSLDLFTLLKNEVAEKILKETNNNQYENYEKNLNDFAAKLEKFDQHTWHDNAYLSLLSSLQSLVKTNSSGWPTFMQNEAWLKKTLNTSLAAWVDFHREINYERTSLLEEVGLVAYSPYGYIEPQLEFYQQLLANVEMITNGFTTLKIISPQDKSFDRLKNLKEILNQCLQISKKELENINLQVADYSFINNFGKKIRGVTGDIKKESIKNSYRFTYQGKEKTSLEEAVENFDYLIIIYPDTEGKLFFAIGPVFNYLEKNNLGKRISDWQADFKLK